MVQSSDHLEIPGLYLRLLLLILPDNHILTTEGSTNTVHSLYGQAATNLRQGQTRVLPEQGEHCGFFCC